MVVRPGRSASQVSGVHAHDETPGKEFIIPTITIRVYIYV